MEGAPFVVAEKGKVCVRVRRGRRGSEFGVADRQGLPTETFSCKETEKSEAERCEPIVPKFVEPRRPYQRCFRWEPLPVRDPEKDVSRIPRLPDGRLDVAKPLGAEK